MIIIPIPRTEYQMFIRSKNGGQYDMKKVFFYFNKYMFVQKCCKDSHYCTYKFLFRPKILYLAKQLFIFSDYEKVHCRNDWNDGARPYGMW